MKQRKIFSLTTSIYNIFWLSFALFSCFFISGCHQGISSDTEHVQEVSETSGISETVDRETLSTESLSTSTTQPNSHMDELTLVYINARSSYQVYSSCLSYTDWQSENKVKLLVTDEMGRLVWQETLDRQLLGENDIVKLYLMEDGVLVYKNRSTETYFTCEYQHITVKASTNIDKTEKEITVTALPGRRIDLEECTDFFNQLEKLRREGELCASIGGDYLEYGGGQDDAKDAIETVKRLNIGYMEVSDTDSEFEILSELQDYVYGYAINEKQRSVLNNIVEILNYAYTSTAYEVAFDTTFYESEIKNEIIGFLEHFFSMQGEVVSMQNFPKEVSIYRDEEQALVLKVSSNSENIYYNRDMSEILDPKEKNEWDWMFSLYKKDNFDLPNQAAKRYEISFTNEWQGKWNVWCVISDILYRISDTSSDAYEAYYIVSEIYSSLDRALPDFHCFYLEIEQDNMGYPYPSLLIDGDFNQGSFCYFPDCCYGNWDASISYIVNDAYSALNANKCAIRIKTI